MTILFQNGILQGSNKESPELDILLINGDKKTYVNPLEDLDQNEKVAILTDIINSDPI